MTRAEQAQALTDARRRLARFKLATVAASVTAFAGLAVAAAQNTAVPTTGGAASTGSVLAGDGSPSAADTGTGTLPNGTGDPGQSGSSQGDGGSASVPAPPIVSAQS